MTDKNDRLVEHHAAIAVTERGPTPFVPELVDRKSELFVELDRTPEVLHLSVRGELKRYPKLARISIRFS